MEGKATTKKDKKSLKIQDWTTGTPLKPGVQSGAQEE